VSRMKYVSVCSGIEAATVAWHHLGWEPAWFSEIEPFPCSALKHHYPNVPNLGDMTKWSEWPDETIDVLVGGTPCQSFSVAGKRAGMDDPRGQLALAFSAIARRYKPRWIVWENVPGVLSSGGGRDFGAFIGALAELGYGCAYRVLDAQHFGVAQRRRRVFVVGHLGDWRCAAAVLFERESLCRDIAKGGKAREEVAGTIASRFGRSRNNHEECVAKSLVSRNGAGGFDLETETPVICGTPSARSSTARQWPAKIASTLYASFGSKLGQENQHINEGAPLFVLSSGQAGAEISCDRSPTLTCLHETPIVLMDQDQLGEVRTGEVFNTINTNSNASGRNTPMVAFPANMSATQRASTEDVACNLQARNPTAVASALQVRRLTPIECERLQGFPDNYTNVPHRGKPAADGPRYKSLGNSMAVPVMRWIGERIEMVESIMESEGGEMWNP
jgi:DNA (cytosine-5)-methyltransferase 1